MTLLERQTDGELARRAAAGDRVAFDGLVRRHQGWVQSVAYGRLGDFEDARDAVQAAFVAAWRGLPRLRETEKAKAWLRTLVENESRMIARRRRDTVALDDRQGPDEFGLLELRLALDSLPEAEREALTLCALGGHAVAEAADFLGVARTTVESRLRNARSRLRRETLTMTEKTLIDHRLPDDFATKLPLPYDEFDFTTKPRTPEPFGAFRREWLLSHRPAGAEVLSVEAVDDETTRVTLSDGIVAQIQYTGRRGGIEDEAALLPILKKAGLPVPDLLAPPIIDPAAPERGALSAVEAPKGTPLHLWAASAPLKAQDAACEQLLNARDAVASATDAVLAAGIRLERCTLAEELSRTVSLGGPWLQDPEFAAAITRLEPILANIDDGVVLSNSGNPPHTIQVDDQGSLLAYWGFAWARLEDPHYGVTKMWTYDCWPFRQLGIVERYLVRYGLSKADFAPRLAVRALATLQRETSVAGKNTAYRESLRGWLRLAMSWL